MGDRIVDRLYSLALGRTSDARQRLVASGRKLMHEKGYTAVGVAEVCSHAGVNNTRVASTTSFPPSRSWSSK